MPSETLVQFRVLTLSGVILLGLPMRQAQQVGGGKGSVSPNFLAMSAKLRCPSAQWSSRSMWRFFAVLILGGGCTCSLHSSTAEMERQTSLLETGLDT